MKSPASLTNGNLVIRPYTNDDAPSLYDAARESIETVGRWMPWCHPGYSARESEEWIALCQSHWADGVEFEFGIFGVDSNELWGGTGINQVNRMHNFGNLGYWVRASRTRQGVASTAAWLAARFAFLELELSRVEIVAAVGNFASRRVAEKLGAEFECVARNRLRVKGRLLDAAVYSLVPSDVLRMNRPLGVPRQLAAPARKNEGG